MDVGFYACGCFMCLAWLFWLGERQVKIEICKCWSPCRKMLGKCVEFENASPYAEILGKCFELERYTK